MVRPVLFLLVATFLVSHTPVFACSGEEHAQNQQTSNSDIVVSTSAATVDKTQIKVAGLHCASCEKSINASLSKVKGVQTIAWNKKKNIVEVTYAKGSTTSAELLSAITAAGDDFKATVLE